MVLIKHYKGVNGKGTNLWKALCDEDREGHNCNSHFAKWVDGQQESYMSKDWDSDRIQQLVWQFRNVKLINIFEDKLNIKIDELMGGGSPDRNDLLRFTKSRKLTKDERVLMKEFYEYFTKDLNDKRCGEAYEMACDDFDQMLPNNKSDENVAEFINIDLEVEGYTLDNGDYVESKDVVGICRNCDGMFKKEDLFNYNKGLKQKANFDIESDEIGICPNCGEPLFSKEITDEETKLVVVI